MPETYADTQRYFNVERVPATQLDALLDGAEHEGHRLIHLRVERRAGTATFVYTLFFRRGHVTKVSGRARMKKKPHAKEKTDA